MASHALTKKVLAAGLKELMQSVPLSKLSVGDICEHCGISRNTFYYHFKDKFDLVTWIFYTETTTHITAFSSYDTWTDGLLALCLYLQENRKFYLHALEGRGQNSLSEYLVKLYTNLLSACIDELKGDMELSAEKINFISRFYTHALMGVLMDWVNSGMRTDPHPSVMMIKSLVNGALFEEIKTHTRH